jgi:hypothetical protein
MGRADGTPLSVIDRGNTGLKFNWLSLWGNSSTPLTSSIRHSEKLAPIFAMKNNDFMRKQQQVLLSR